MSQEEILHGIYFQPTAIENAIRLAEDAKKPPHYRLYLDGKGCDGFYYGIALIESEEPEDLRFCLEKEVVVLVDRDTYEFVRGSEVEWVDDERGCGFLVLNPRHNNFKGKFYKRPFWQKKYQERLGLEGA